MRPKNITDQKTTRDKKKLSTINIECLSRYLTVSKTVVNQFNIFHQRKWIQHHQILLHNISNREADSIYHNNEVQKINSTVLNWQKTDLKTTKTRWMYTVTRQLRNSYGTVTEHNFLYESADKISYPIAIQFTCLNMSFCFYKRLVPYFYLLLQYI